MLLHIIKKIVQYLLVWKGRCASNTDHDKIAIHSPSHHQAINNYAVDMHSINHLEHSDKRQER